MSVAGRVLLSRDGKITHNLVHIEKPILCIPNLAIHLDRETNNKFSPNKESHLVPILATTIHEKLNSLSAPKESEKAESGDIIRQADKHHSVLIDLICKELHCTPEEIVDLELQLVDTQPAVLGGAFEEFIFGGRLDNQVGAYCSIKSIIEAANDNDSLASETGKKIQSLLNQWFNKLNII